MTDLLTELEVLVTKWDTHLSSRYYSKELAILIAAEKARGPEPRQMSCPICCEVRKCVEIREMMCSACGQVFQTCEQLDASLAARHESLAPDPLLVQAREALERYDKIVGTIHYTHPHLGWSDEDGALIKATFAALDAKLGERP